MTRKQLSLCLATSVLTCLLIPELLTAQDQIQTLPPLVVITPENAPLLTEIATLGSGRLTGDVAWSPDGSTLAMGSTNGVWLADVATGEKRQLTSGEPAEQVAYNSNGNLLGYVSRDNQVVIVNSQTGAPIRSFDDALTFAFYPAHPNELLLYSEIHAPESTPDPFSMMDGTRSYRTPILQLWSVYEQGPLLDPVLLKGQSLNGVRRAAMQLSPDGTRALVTNDNGLPDSSCERSDTLELWTIEPSTRLERQYVGWADSPEIMASPIFGLRAELYQFRQPFGPATIPDYDSYGFHVDNFNEGKPLDQFISPSALTHHPATALLAAANRATITFYDTMTYEPLRSEQIDGFNEIEHLRYSPDGRLLALTRDGQMEIWQVDPWQRVDQFQLSADSVISPDGTAFLTRNEHNEPMLTRFQDDSLITRPFPFTWRASRWSENAFFRYGEYPPGRVLLPSSSGEHTVHYLPGDRSCREENDWVHLSRGEESIGMSVSASNFSSYVFSGDERLLAITGDHWLRVWETESGQLLADMEGVNLKSVHFSDDQRLLAAVDAGSVVHLWGVPE